MPSSRPGVRRTALLAVTAVLCGGLLAVPISAVNASVTGSLTYLERVAPSPEAVAIVTIVDQTAAPVAGAVTDPPTDVAAPADVAADATSPADPVDSPTDPTRLP